MHWIYDIPKLNGLLESAGKSSEPEFYPTPSNPFYKVWGVGCGPQTGRRVGAPVAEASGLALCYASSLGFRRSACQLGIPVTSFTVFDPDDLALILMTCFTAVDPNDLLTIFYSGCLLPAPCAARSRRLASCLATAMS
eukprot:365952-Chlamydomonas_euryale.AAC.1